METMAGFLLLNWVFDSWMGGGGGDHCYLRGGGVDWWRRGNMRGGWWVIIYYDDDDVWRRGRVMYLRCYTTHTPRSTPTTHTYTHYCWGRPEMCGIFLFVLDLVTLREEMEKLYRVCVLYIKHGWLKQKQTKIKSSSLSHAHILIHFTLKCTHSKCEKGEGIPLLWNICLCWWSLCKLEFLEQVLTF